MKTKCEFETCDRDSATKGLCLAHYMQRHRGRPLTPLAKYTRLHKDEKGRECTTCGEYKPWDHFYVRTTGARWAECRACGTKRARRDYLIRVGRQDEVQ